MPIIDSPFCQIAAHSIAVSEDQFAYEILFDGRDAKNENSALVLQSAISEEDGEDIYAEIPVQRFASDTGIRKAIVTNEWIRLYLNDPLNDFYNFEISLSLISTEERKAAIDFLVKIFNRQPESLEIE